MKITSETERRIEAALSDEQLGPVEEAGLRLSFELYRDAQAALVEAEVSLGKWLYVLRLPPHVPLTQQPGETWGEFWARNMNASKARKEKECAKPVARG